MTISRGACRGTVTRTPKLEIIIGDYIRRASFGQTVEFEVPAHNGVVLRADGYDS